MGWDIERFPEGEVNLELICCICTCILEDPVESPCRHVFCSKCIRTWLVNQKSCPHCRATVHRRDLKSVVPLLKNIISKQRIFCDYKEMGCTELIPLENLENHTQVCQYSLVVCSNAGCTTKVLRKDHKTHAEVCAKRMVMCEQGCEMLLTLGDRSSHNCIRALYSHFQGVTNELLGRIAKLEEQVNVLTSKNHGNSNNYGQVPYSIPSPHNYTTFPEIHPDNNLTSYPVDAATDGGATSAEEDEGEEDFTADQAYQDRNDFVVRPAVHHQNNRRGGQRNRGNRVNHTSPVNMSPVYDNSSPALSPLHHRISSPRSNNRPSLSPRYRSRSPQPVLLRIGLQPSAANSSTSSSASSSSNESEISD